VPPTDSQKTSKTTYKWKLRLVALAFIVLALVYSRSALSYGTELGGGNVEPGVAPLFAGGALIFLSLLLIVTAHRQQAPEDAAPEEQRAQVSTAMRFFGALVVYALLVNFVGFLPATFVGVAAMLRLFFAYSVRRMLLYAGSLTLACYLIFDLALGVNLP
jgi:hypothetical protein